jgi:DNA-binding CsgD family transcriptional regulator
VSTPLSPRELEVARLRRAGHPAREIAAALGIAVGTVKALSSRVYRTLGISGRTELAGIDLTTYARRRRCELDDCGRLFTPRRRDQRFHVAACRRKFARHLRARRRLEDWIATQVDEELGREQERAAEARG